MSPDSSPPRFTVEQLTTSHNVAAFDSGQPDLDTWLKFHALTGASKRISRTFVWHENGRVVAFYTLSAHLISRDEIPRRLGRGDPNQIPAALLGRLALDVSLHGQGLGGVLLSEALSRIVGADVAARYVVVDAIDEAAAAFYRRYGFTDTPAAGRLVRKVSDIAADLATE